jgi:hypothetical protein
MWINCFTTPASYIANDTERGIENSSLQKTMVHGSVQCVVRKCTIRASGEMQTTPKVLCRCLSICCSSFWTDTVFCFEQNILPVLKYRSSEVFSGEINHMKRFLNKWHKGCKREVLSEQWIVALKSELAEGELLGGVLSKNISVSNENLRGNLCCT